MTFLCLRKVLQLSDKISIEWNGPFILRTSRWETWIFEVANGDYVDMDAFNMTVNDNYNKYEVKYGHNLLLKTLFIVLEKQKTEHNNITLVIQTHPGILMCDFAVSTLSGQHGTEAADLSNPAVWVHECLLRGATVS